MGEIDGLRGVALTLVVLFHVFGGGRVSGGVDVFLVISGYLTAGSVLRRASTGRLTVPGAWAKDLVRLAPTALVVLLAVVGGMFALLPAPRWEAVLREAAASATSWENWRLIDAELAYGAAGPAASPLQHFWSLAVQVQYLAALPVLALGCAMLAGYAGRVSARAMTATRVFAVVVGTLTAASFAFAVWQTSADQPVAYFHGFARVWEIGAGALLALVAPRLRMAGSLRAVAGWTGLVAVVSCGFLFDGGALFPGPATLFPVTGALLVLVATAGAPTAPEAPARGARAGSGVPAEVAPRRDGAALGTLRRVLGSSAPRWLATISYALYVWHWPVLIGWLAATGRERAGIADGAGIVGVSVLLAWATVRWVARPVERWAAGERVTGQRVAGPSGRRVAERSPAGQLVAGPAGWRVFGRWVARSAGRRVFGRWVAGSAGRPGARPVERKVSRAHIAGVVLAVVSALVAGGSWVAADRIAQGDVAELAQLRQPSAAHPGAAALRAGQEPASPDVPFRPSAGIAARDGRHVTDCANGDRAATEVVSCVIAAPDGEPAKRVHLVGGSHTQHWEDAWVQVAEGAGWEVTAIIKHGCRLAVGKAGTQPGCPGWAANALDHVIAERPDVVVVEGTETTTDGTDVLLPEQAAVWAKLTDAGIPVIAVRDTPRFDRPPPDCLAANAGLPRPEAVAACSVPRSEVFAEASPANAGTPGAAGAGVVHLDLTDAICGPETCAPVVGNVLVYRDEDHFTGTYVTTLGPDLESALRREAPWLFS
ncbi:hypothetical protein GCM10009751_04600 [Myceligenerans crystallogenes]|uniref:Peptidoglycan/LPS O-acetylase OafA/YrhL, contains acyltransferase and SGNH-hydrolase domains n=1 Tax=Myceligenerans crystallogenes TaxID=316335 RepID=A0ABP4ZJ06_9MICO